MVKNWFQVFVFIRSSHAVTLIVKNSVDSDTQEPGVEIPLLPKTIPHNNNNSNSILLLQI